MKRLLLVLFCLSCCFCYAQKMSFLGIPMGTDIGYFKQELLAKSGFKDHPLPYENIYGVDGLFAGMQAAISIETTPKSKLVCAVVVAFTDYSYDVFDFNAEQLQKSQEDMYDYIRLKLINKYGNPTQNTISYDSYIKWCFWVTKDGRIDLMITQPADTRTYRKIQVIYIDGTAEQQSIIEEDADW